MRRMLVLCDRCGHPIGALSDAVLAQRLDELGRIVELNLDHAACAAARRQELDESDRTIVDYPAADLLRQERADALRATARAHWASATRIRRNVERLRVPTLTGESLDGALAVTLRGRSGPDWRHNT